MVSSVYSKVFDIKFINKNLENNLIGKGNSRLVYLSTLNENEIIKIPKTPSYSILNENEINLFKKLKENGLEDIVGKINLEKSNKNELHMEKLKDCSPLYDDFSKFKSISKVSVWNNDILDFIEFKDGCRSKKIETIILKYEDSTFSLGQKIKKIFDLTRIDKNYLRLFEDISFENIGLDENKNIKILDFS